MLRLSRANCNCACPNRLLKKACKSFYFPNEGGELLHGKNLKPLTCDRICLT